MKQQYTLGPWKCSQYLGYPAWSVHMDAGDRGRGSTIVDGVAGIDLEQRLANARLIAAAPDLLDALQDVCARLMFRGVSHDAGNPDRTALNSARAAIAKALGEK